MPKEREYLQFLEDVCAKLVPERTYQFEVRVKKTGGSASGDLYWKRTHQIGVVGPDSSIVPLDALVESGHGGYESESELRTEEEELRESFYRRIEDFAFQQSILTTKTDINRFTYSRRAWQAEECKRDLLKATANEYSMSPEDAQEFLPDNE